MKIPNHRLYLEKLLVKKPTLLRFSALVSVPVIALIVVLVLASLQKSNVPPGNTAAYLEQLRGQVDTETGAPRSGRDPAAQSQGSLAAVASQPTGAGQKVNKPAASVNDDQSSHHGGTHTSSDPSQTGLGTNGCYIDYGIQGEQCLPAHAATNGTLTCEGVRQHFATGIKITGTDRFNLDTNQDNIACGNGD